ncbi:MAG: DUF86 domain-containing protein [Armatimonadota bacterium]|nr:DUF86 domain-containing protein [Armatimonadota bacterium]
MSRSVRLFIQDMLECARKVVRYTHGLSREAFFANELVHDAVLRNLEILGEAAKQVPASMRSKYPQVDWRGIAGLRDILAHAYFALDGAPTDNRMSGRLLAPAQPIHCRRAA